MMTINDNNMVDRASLKALINDINFDKIELGLKNPNIFRILKISKTEIRHSNFLVWLLDPYESHNLKDAFLKRFIQDISIEIDFTSSENIEIRREWRNIDILIISENLVICIENKVESNEHSDQLSRYKKIVKENFPDKEIIFIYLTPTRSTASEIEYKSYSYEEIANILRKIIKLYNRKLTTEVLHYIKDYLETLKLEIMENDKLNELAIQLYNRHKETFEFIFQNKPDIAFDFYQIFEKKVLESGWITGSTNKGVVRFLTPKLKEILPQLKGNNQKESLVFELDYYWLNQKQLCFKTIIAPGEGTTKDEEIRNLISTHIEEIKDARKPNGKKWLVHFIEKHPFKLDEMKEKTDDQIYNHIESFWARITAIVNNIESVLLENQDSLIKLKD